MLPCHGWAPSFFGVGTFNSIQAFRGKVGTSRMEFLPSRRYMMEDQKCVGANWRRHRSVQFRVIFSTRIVGGAMDGWMMAYSICTESRQTRWNPAARNRKGRMAQLMIMVGFFWNNSKRVDQRRENPPCCQNDHLGFLILMLSPFQVVVIVAWCEGVGMRRIRMQTLQTA